MPKRIVCGRFTTEDIDFVLDFGLDPLTERPNPEGGVLDVGDSICTSLHDMGLDLSGNGSAETTYDEGDQNLAVG